MAESRDSSLPGGMSDLIELIEQERQTDQAFEKLSAEVRTYCRNLAPIVFETFAQKIDPDLLYTEDADLILPKLREVASQALYSAPAAPTHGSISPWVIDVLAQELWRLICLRRPFRQDV